MKIVCLGDSLTAGYKLLPEERWVNILEKETSCSWINRGISGDCSNGVLVRLHTEAFPERPDYVLMMCGFNDIMLTGSFDMAKASVMAMFHQCPSYGVKPVIGIPFPIKNIPEKYLPLCDPYRAKSCSIEYIAWLRKLVDISSLRCVDFALAFEQAEREGRGELYQPDGMHPSALGSRLMAEQVKKSSWLQLK